MKCLQIVNTSIAWCSSEASLKTLILSTFLIATHAANAGVIALNSELYLQAQARSNGSAITVDIDRQSQLSALNNLSASVSAIATSPGATMEVTGSGSATWVNAAQGQVLFNDLGWNSVNNNGSSLADIGGFSGLPIWTYTFIADLTGLFTIDWSVFVHNSTTNTFGLGRFRFALTGAGGGQRIFNVGGIGATNSGTSTLGIVAGQQYTARLTNDAGLVGGLATQTAFMDGTFNWSMDSGPFESVPEPTSMSLFMLALASLVLGTRQKSTGGTRIT